MQIISQKIYKELDYNKYFINKKTCFLDIETTGLSRIFNSVYLVGILYYEHDAWKLTQIFAESTDEEKSLLSQLKDYIKLYDEVITYNGDTFDIPFINERAQKYNLPEIISKDLSRDLYRLVKNNRYILNLDKLKLKSLERYLGVYREDLYSGKDCIDFYLNYTKTRDNNLLSKILKHNFDDLFYMLDIIKITDVIKEKRSLSINYNNIYLELYIENMEHVGDIFLIYGEVVGNNGIKLIHYSDSYKICLENGGFEITLEYSLGMVTQADKGMYVDKNKLVLSDSIVDSTSYKLPKNIVLLKVESQFCIDNIKSIVADLVRKTIMESF